ncbi:MAG: hypothetical protein AAF743_13805, partial [Planctomycetota bacterium]
MRKLKQTVLAMGVLGLVGSVGLMSMAQNRPPQRGPGSYLSDADVQVIRRAELRENDTEVGFRFMNNLRRRFVES